MATQALGSTSECIIALVTDIPERRSACLSKVDRNFVSSKKDRQ